MQTRLKEFTKMPKRPKGRLPGMAAGTDDGRPERKIMDYKRTIKEVDGLHIVIYQDNGWQQHIKIYTDGNREEWLEPDHQ